MVTLRFTLPNSESDTLKLDAALSEQHSSSAEVTQFPVETGTDISDHVRPQPDRLRIEGIVSNSPVRDVGGDTDDRKKNGATDAYFFSIRAGSAYEKLKKIHSSGVAIVILTELRTYENMVMRSLDVPRSADTGDVLRFSAEFQEIVTVSTQSAELPHATKSGKKSGGKKPTETVDASKAGRPKSTARAIYDAARGVR